MQKRIILLLMLFLPACTREPVTRPGGEAVVRILPSLAEMPAATKGPVTGTVFPDNGTYGIFVCERGSTTTAHKPNSWNIRARYSNDADSWNYYYAGDFSTGATTAASCENITLTVREDGAAADLYAYAPYTQNAFLSGPEAIPFTIAGRVNDQADLMYAVENPDPAANTDLDPGSGGELTARFSFRHVLSLLAFQFRLVNGASSYSLTDIGITLRDPDADGVTTARLYTSGTFNALTGAVNPGGTVSDSMNISFSPYYPTVNSADRPATAYLLLVPTEVDDDELVFTFTMNGQTLQPFVLKRAHLLHDDGVTSGFQPGCKYTFHFTLDNYVCFDGITVSRDWTAEILGTEEI